MYLVTTFYKFVQIEDLHTLRSQLLKCCKENKLKGTIIIANEGLNATLVGQESDVQEFYHFIRSYKDFQDVFFQETLAELMPFQKMKIKIKPEIVAFKKQDLDTTDRGEYVEPRDWDGFVSEEGVSVIDTRNYYEVAMGSFKGAINPNTNNFSDFITWAEQNLPRDKLETRIAMFCTGGVRCEKSTAYLKSLGFKNVYHLKGGVINYLQYKKSTGADSVWEGACFIFDDRLALDSALNPVNP